MKPNIYVDSIESLEETIHRLIPISAQMGISVVSYTGDALTLNAPLAPNVNHQQSAFGGSLFSIAVLTGWGLMQMKLSELLLDCNTVVAGGEVTYLKPVFSDLQCTCNLPANADAFFARLDSTHRASTRMNSMITQDGELAMELEGRYHVQRKDIGA